MYGTGGWLVYGKGVANFQLSRDQVEGRLHSSEGELSVSMLLTAAHGDL